MLAVPESYRLMESPELAALESTSGLSIEGPIETTNVAAIDRPNTATPIMKRVVSLMVRAAQNKVAE